MKRPVLPPSGRKNHPVTEVTQEELTDGPTNRILNAGNILGAAAFTAMLLAPGAVEGGNYVLGLALTAVTAVCARLAVREDGKR